MFQALPLLILMILQGLGSHSGASAQSLEAQLRLQNRYFSTVVRQERVNAEQKVSIEASAAPRDTFDAPTHRRECTKLKQSGFSDSRRSRDGPGI